VNRNPTEVLQGAALALVGASLVAYACCLSHCSASTPTAAQQVPVAELGLALDGCVATSPSAAAYVACRASVLASFGIDAGAYVPADAGHDAAPILILTTDAGAK
jgi:hypothetical protein